MPNIRNNKGETIYTGGFYDEVLKTPSDIDYYLDFIDSSAAISQFSISNIGRRTKAIVDDDINCLFEPEIPGNTGNIMRTCVATNTKLHLIEPLGFSLDEKYIRRSGVNYIDNCEYTVYKNWDDFYSKNKDNGKFYFLTRYGHKPHTSFDYSNSDENIFFVFGKESTGIPRDILKPHLDTCMRMPMTDNVRSLNLSNTVAIMVYECLRQQNYNDLLRDEPHKSSTFIEDFNED